jgi:hypothetical protein
MGISGGNDEPNGKHDFYHGWIGLLARNDFRVARDLGVVERMLPSQVRAAIFTVGLPRPRCTEDTGSGC